MNRMASETVNCIKHVTVIGGGLMGSGIAQIIAQTGYQVTLVDVSEEVLNLAKAHIAKRLQRFARKQFDDDSPEALAFVQETLQRVSTSTDVLATVRATDLVIEAIVESITAKQELFASIDQIAPERTIFTSNTSSLSIGVLGSVTGRRNRFAGLHFFNPVPQMKLLEVIRSDDTSAATFETIMAFGRSLGKVCIVCKDTAGFVVNRLLLPYLFEAMRMFERGDASLRDIDVAMRLGAGHRMGPFELADYIGLDTTRSILLGWHAKEPDNPLFQPLPALERLVAEGKLGAKSGEGFYSYEL